MYGNEKEVGETVKESGIDRSAIFISKNDILCRCSLLIIDIWVGSASKVPARNTTYDTCTKVINNSLRLIDTGKYFAHKRPVLCDTHSPAADYLDLYLIHSPPRGKGARLTMWKALVDAKKDGKLKDIGVSN